MKISSPVVGPSHVLGKHVLGKDEAHRYPAALLSKVSIGKASMHVQRETGTNCPDDVLFPR